MADDSGPATMVLTFLIADVRGYTRFTRERGDAAAAILAKRFADLARDAVEARSGRVIELRGDEALAVFEVPGQAVRAAVELQATFAEESEADSAFAFPVGMGIDSGEAAVVEEGYRGSALNMAARLCSSAGAGQVLVTPSVVASAGSVDPDIRFEDRGPASFKGYDQAVAVLEAIRHQESVRPFEAPLPAQDRGVPPELDPLTPLVDRDHQMRWLRGTWRQVRRGRGRLLFVSGPAQIGKTRLAGELAAYVHAGGGAIRYAGPGGAAAATALAEIRAVIESSAPALLVLDDVAGPAVARELLGAFETLAGRPVLVLSLLRDPAPAPDLSALIERADERGDGHRMLEPLDLEGVRGIVRLYAGDDAADVPVESIARASHGIPGRVHEVVSDWARSEATRRLTAAGSSWRLAGTVTPPTWNSPTT
jgi:adenylate cyclase